ncbi:MAG: uridine monophosphate kinase [bacterium]
MNLKYKRVLLKISGEAFGGEENKLFNFTKVQKIAELMVKIKKEGAQVVLVNGAGNLFRGAKQKEIEREAADYIGMVATLMNSLALQAVLNKMKEPVVTYSSFGVEGLAEKFNAKEAQKKLEEGLIVISTAGNGKPYFTNDTAGVQRAIDLKCDLMIKASTIDGVYSDDPRTNPDAKKFEKISYDETLDRDLKVLDRSAVEIAKEHNLKIIVTSFDSGSILKALQGEKVGTLIN